MPVTNEDILVRVRTEGVTKAAAETRELAAATDKLKASARTASFGSATSSTGRALTNAEWAAQQEATFANMNRRLATLQARNAAAAAALPAASARRPAFGERGRAIATAAGAGRFAGLAAPFGGWGPLLAIGAGFTAVNQIRQGVENIGLNQQLSAQTTAGIKSTGGAANVTAKHIDDLSNSLAKLAGVQDESVHDSENILLTFANIRNEAGKGNKVFDQTSLAVANIAARMHTDMPQAALQVGKALNDPIRGMGALRRIGVQFTHQQEDQIKVMVASGNRMGAQKIILHELNREFGGSATAAGKTLPAALTRMSEAWEDSRNRLLIKSMPYMIRFTDWLTKELPGAIDTALTAISLFDTDPKANALSRWVHKSFGGKAGRTFDYILTHSGRDMIADADKKSGGWLGRVAPHPEAVVDPIQHFVSRGLFGLNSPDELRKVQQRQAAEAGMPSDWTGGKFLPRSMGGKGMGDPTPFSQNDVRAHWDAPLAMLDNRPIQLVVDGKVLAQTTVKAQQKQAHAEGRGSGHKP